MIPAAHSLGQRLNNASGASSLEQGDYATSGPALYRPKGAPFAFALGGTLRASTTVATTGTTTATATATTTATKTATATTTTTTCARTTHDTRAASRACALAKAHWQVLVSTAHDDWAGPLRLFRLAMLWYCVLSASVRHFGGSWW